MTKFVVEAQVEKCMFLVVRHAVIPRSEPQRPNFWILPTPVRCAIKFDMVTHVVDGHVLGVSHAPHLEGAASQRLWNPLPRPTRFDLKRPNSVP